MADNPWIKAFPHPVAAYVWDAAAEAWIPAPSVMVVSGPLTDAELRAAPVPVSLDEPISVSFFDARIAVTAFPEDTVWSDVLNALNEDVTCEPGGLNTFGINVVTWDDWIGTLVPEVSVNGVAYVSCQAVNSATGEVVTEITEAGTFILPCGGYMRMRVRCSAYTQGQALVTLRGSVATNVGTIPLNDTQLRASPVPIMGVVSGPATSSELGIQLLISKFGQTLLEMLDELKKICTHLALITDEEV